MEKKSLIACAIAVLLASPAAAKITELENWHTKVDSVIREATVLCIDGQKFVFAFGNGTGTSVALTQVFEERDGQVVPADCSPPKFVPPEKKN